MTFRFAIKSTLRGILLAMVPALLLLYTLAGFWLAPVFIKHYLTGGFSEKTGLEVQVGTVSLNPFTLELHMEKLLISEPGKVKLLAFEHLGVDISGLSLPGDSITIESVALDQPYAQLAFDREGKLTIVEKFRQAFASGETTADDEPVPSVALQQLHIDDGQVDISIAQGKKPFRQTLLLESITLEDLHTSEAGHANRLVAALATPEQASLTLEAKLDMPARSVAGKLAVQQYNLQPLLAALQLPVDIHLATLPADLSTSFALKLQEPLQLTLNDSELNLHSIRISAEEGAPPVLDLPLLHIAGINFEWPQQRVTVDKVALPDGKIQLAIDKLGQTNLQALFATQAEPEAAASAQPWSVQVKSLEISNYSLQVHSETTATPVDMRVAPVSVSISNWQPLDAGKTFPLHISADLPDAGMVELLADVQIKPLLASGKASLKNLSLPLLQPLANEFSLIDIRKGIVASDIDFTVQQPEGQQGELQVEAKGSMQLNDFRIRKQNSMKKLLSWKSLSIGEFAYRLPANLLNITQVDISQSYGRFIIGQDGISNMQGLLKPSVPSDSNQSASNQSTKPLQWDIGRVNVLEGDMGFSDLSLQPAFRTAIKSLNGTISNMSSRAGVLAKVDLKGKVDKYAPVSIGGDFSLSLDKPQLDVEMDFRNIELSSFTPYSGIYAGHAIDRGQVSMELRYKLVEKRIKGENHIVINQLQLGKKVESDKVIDLPLKLALALLTDENGVIDLGFEVSGDITSPQFALDDVIFKALKDMLKKVVTAPFKYLRGAFGGKQVNVQRLAFDAGSDAATATISDKLATVATYLKEKPALVLNVQGNVLPEVDRPALQEQELLQILSVETRQRPELFLPANQPATNAELLAIVSDYYQTQRNEPFTALEQRLTVDAQSAGATPDALQIRAQAYGQAWRLLLETTPVTDDDLYDLAQRRAQQAKVILVDKHGIDAGRIFVLDSQSSSAEPSLTTRLFVDVRE